MAKRFSVPRRIYDAKNEDLAEHARGVQEVFDRIRVVEDRVVEQLYAEPMTLALEAEPLYIECPRIVNLFQQDLPVIACSGMVHFTWKPRNGGAVITNISGMSVAANGGIKYRFYFRITNRMGRDG